MAIKIYERRTGEAALPGVRQRLSANPEAFGAGFAQAGRQVASAVGEVGAAIERIKAKQDSAIAMDFGARANELDQQFMKEMLENDGENGLKWSEKAADRYAKELEKHFAALPGDRNRDALRAMRDNRITAFRQSLARYVNTNSELVRKQKFDGLMSSSIASATTAARLGDRWKVGDAIKQMEASVDDFASKSGLPKEAAEKMKREALAPLVSSVVDELISKGSIDNAKTMFADMRDRIPKAAQDNIKEALAAATENNFVGDLALSLEKKHSSEDYFNLESAIEELDAQVIAGKISTKQRDAAVAKLSTAKANRDKARTAADAPALDYFLTQIYDGKKIDRTSQIYMRLSLEGKRKIAKAEYLDRKENQKIAAQYGLAAIDEYRSRPFQERVNVDVDRDEPFASAPKKHRARIKAMQRVDKDKDGQTSEAYTDTYTSAFRDAFPNLNTGKGRGLARFRRYRDEMDQLFSTYFTKHRSLPDEKTVDSWIRRSLTEYIKVDRVLEFMDETERYYLMSDEDQKKARDGVFRRVGEEADQQDAADSEPAPKPAPKPESTRREPPPQSVKSTEIWKTINKKAPARVNRPADIPKDVLRKLVKIWYAIDRARPKGKRKGRPSAEDLKEMYNNPPPMIGK